MKDFWNARYKELEYAYGITPNAFLQDILGTVAEKGSILMAAEGEGRNAVYAAKLGWQVLAFDLSIEAKHKAIQLANKEGVTLDYEVNSIEQLSYENSSVDALVLIYAHFSPEKRRDYHRKLVNYLRPGGFLIIEAFEKGHVEKQRLNPSVGGPGRVDMLYSLEDLKEDFKCLEFIQLEKVDIELSEGVYHKGEATVVRALARKKSFS